MRILLHLAVSRRKQLALDRLRQRAIGERGFRHSIWMHRRLRSHLNLSIADKNLHGFRGVQPSRQEAATVGRAMRVAGIGAAEQSGSNALRIGLAAELQLDAEQQGGQTGNDRGREAGAALQRNAAAGSRSGNVQSGGQDALGSVGLPPIAQLERRTLVVHGADRQNRCHRGRNVQAFAAVVSGGGDDQDIMGCAGADCLCKNRLGLAGARQLAAADVDDMRSAFDSLENRPRQVELRAQDDGIARPVGKNRNDKAATPRRDTGYRGAVLAKDDARNVRSVPGGEPFVRLPLHQRLQLRDQRAVKAGMRPVDGAIQDRHADPRVAARLVPNRRESQQACQICGIPRVGSPGVLMVVLMVC
jgi:hypothetical protein